MMSVRRDAVVLDVARPSDFNAVLPTRRSAVVVLGAASVRSELDAVPVAGEIASDGAASVERRLKASAPVGIRSPSAIVVIRDALKA